MIRAVVDTNVLVSGIVSRTLDSAPALIVNAWREGRFELALSPVILEEVTRTLHKPYFRSRVSNDHIDRVLFLLSRRVRPIHPSVKVQGIASHPEDDLILATAVSSEAEYVVTGDMALLALDHYEGVKIGSPRAFIDLLQSLQ